MGIRVNGVTVKSWVADKQLGSTGADTKTLTSYEAGLQLTKGAALEIYIFGSYYAGKLGGMLPKRFLLSSIYFTRAVVISLFLLAPLTPVSVYVFACAMGLLWLSTVPLTNGVIAGIFGVKYLSMLSGFVFLSHQVGSFLGVWLGGYLFTLEGTTTPCGASPSRSACSPRW